MFRHLKHHVQKNEENANRELLSILRLQLCEQAALSLLAGKRRGPSLRASREVTEQENERYEQKKQVANVVISFD